MHIESVVKSGNTIGTVTFVHMGFRTTLTAEDIDRLHEASEGAVLDHSNPTNNTPRCLYPDPSETPKGMPPKKRNRQIYDEYNAGTSIDALTEKYGLKPATIRCIVSNIRCEDRYEKKNQKKNQGTFKTAINSLATSDTNKTSIYGALVRSGIYSLSSLHAKTYTDICKVNGIGRNYADILLNAGLIMPDPEQNGT